MILNGLMFQRLFYCVFHEEEMGCRLMSIIELDETVYCFYYVELDKEPDKSVIKYSGHKEVPVLFTDVFQHGFPYLPVVKLKNEYSIFGLK